MGSINCKESKDSISISTKSYNKTTDDGSLQNTNARMLAGGEFIEKEVCNANDISENEMKEFELTEDEKILVIKQNGKIHAVGTKCPHYGAPLIKGALGQNRLRCPWHGACFNLDTGDIEDFPGLDSIPCYKVIIDPYDKVRIRANKKDLEQNKSIKIMTKRNPCDETTYVVIGGGPSAAVCVETLRQQGFTGRILMICKENALPYDRVKVSKAFTFDLSKIQLREMAFYEKHDIEVLMDVEATKVDANTKIINCSNGYSIKYDKLYIATGSKARKLYAPGSDLGYIMTVRDYTDAKRILELLKPEMDVVCLGSSFIGLESAAALNGKAKSVSVIGKDDFPLQASLGPEIGQRILKLFEEKGVKMLMRSGISECLGEGVIKSVKLLDGSVINCDLLIVGIGSTMHTEFLKDSGININQYGAIDVDMHLRTNIPDVYVGGDIANAPVFSIANQKAAIGHYQLAQYHGKIAALNMVGKMTELKAVPFFFTLLFGKGIRFAGYGKPESIQIEGDLEAMQFIAFYFDKDDNVISMASCNRDPIVGQFAEFQSQGRRLHKKDLKDDILGWTKQISCI